MTLELDPAYRGETKILYAIAPCTRKSTKHRDLVPICRMALEPKSAGPVSRECRSGKCRAAFGLGRCYQSPVILLGMAHLVPGLHRAPELPQAESRWSAIPLCHAGRALGWLALFFVRGWHSVRTRHLNMFTLIALGVSAAYLFSVAAISFRKFFHPNESGRTGAVDCIFEAAAVITVLVLPRQMLEAKARSRTGGPFVLCSARAPKQPV